MKNSYNGINCQCINCGNERSITNRSEGKTIKETYTLYCITSGKGVALSEENRYFLESGVSFITFPFTQTSIVEEKASPLKYFWVEFKGTEAAWIISRTSLSKSSPLTHTPPLEGFERFFIIPEAHGDNAYSSCRASGKLIELLSYYMQFSPNTSEENESYAVAARNYIDRHYRDFDFSVQSVADYIKIDRTYLYRLFKKETGMSVIDYINSCRISRAEALLLDPSISVKDVAYSVGFFDQMYFSRIFKKLRGVTPTEFRRRALSE